MIMCVVFVFHKYLFAYLNAGCKLLFVYLLYIHKNVDLLLLHEIPNNYCFSYFMIVYFLW
jgi:hypothetical protein